MSIEFVQSWWIVFYIAFGVYMYAFAYAGYFVQEDAKKRGMSGPAVTFWSVSVVFFGPIFLPLYLIFRSQAVFAGMGKPESQKAVQKLCPHCGMENVSDAKICAKCHKIMDSDVMAVGKKSCPYCGAMNPVEASRCSACDQVIGFIDDEDS